jgi:hypothetical protein
VTGLRRYAPFALLVAAQIVLVVVAPSKGATSANGPLGGQFNGSSPTAQSSPGALPPTGTTPTTPASGLGGNSSAPAGSPGSTTGSTPPVGSGGSSVATQNGVHAPASGTTTGKPFCVTGINEHPPCVETWAGGSNGGATSMGVTATTVKVIMYRPKDNAAVDAILRETGTYTPASAERQQFQLVADWINKHYQLYGRKIIPIYVQGTCDIAPPVDSCFRAEADTMAAKYKPFAMFWDSDTNEPAFFDELAHKGVVSWGGWGFADGFNDSLRPYHYDVFMGGDTQAQITGAWYCKRLAGKPARFAGSASLKSKTRKVVVIYPNTATTTPAAHHLESIIKSCAGSSSVVDGPYSSNTSTAAQQSTTNVAKYKAAGCTTALWMSDPIAPAYGTKAAAAQNWSPENVIAGGGLLDYDALAQTYDSSQWAHAFGPSDIGLQAGVDQADAGKIWRAEGKSGSPNANSNLLTTYFLSLASGIMAAGPKLTPLTYEYGMLTQPGYDEWSKWHNPLLTYVKYGRGDYTAVSDIREVYYNPNKQSPTNHRPGAYVPLNGGRRYQITDIPSGEPNLPSSV